MSATSKRLTTVYLPVEMAHRELDARLLLAYELLRHGFKVVIGDKHSILKRAGSHSGGIILSIWSAHKNFYNTFKKLRSSRTTIVSMDEESLVTMGPDIYKALRLNPSTLSLIDLYLACGSRDEAYLLDQGMPASKVVQVGNPRIDVLRRVKSSFDKPPTRKKILFVSSFGMGNHFLGREKYLEQLFSTNVIPQQFASDYTRYSENQLINRSSFLDFLCIASKAYGSSVDFVYRLHPAEEVDSTKKLLDESGITLSSGTSLIDDLTTSSLVVHNFCTVAIEARILGIQTLGFITQPYNIPDESIVFSTAPKATTIDEGMLYISDFLQGSPKPASSSPETDKLIYTDISITSSMAISDAIKSVEKTSIKDRFNIKTFILYALWLLKQLVLSQPSSYHLHRKSLLNTSYINKRLSSLCLDGMVRATYRPLSRTFTLSNL